MTDLTNAIEIIFSNPYLIALFGFFMVALIIQFIVIIILARKPAIPVTTTVAQTEILDDSYITRIPERKQQDVEVENKPVLARLFLKSTDLDWDLRQIDLMDKEILFGRSEAADIILSLPFISPEHCLITITEHGQIRIRDLGSKNGTFINSERLVANRDTPLPYGSELGFSRQLVYEIWDSSIVLEPSLSDIDQDLSENHPIDGDEIPFPAIPGIHYADDARDLVSDEYSPI
ncbi:hypothetical protein MASR2M15_11550 [Anaerolineales bacterium]